MILTSTARRLTAFAGAAAVALTLTFAPAAQAGSAEQADALYGTSDPTYDGVFRQSLALVALTAAGREPAAKAVGWLTDQQCADGGWSAYREETSKPCDPATEDTNATAMAVQALVAVGGKDAQRAADKGVAWLLQVRNPDGGVGYNPGGPTDANSTGLLVNALVAASGGEGGAPRNGQGNTPRDALLDLQVGCDAPKDERGAFAYQPDQSGTLLANDSATAAALLALVDGHLPVTGTTSRVQGGNPQCAGEGAGRSQSAGAAAAYLADRLEANDGLMPPLQGKTPDYFTTTNTVLALAAAGQADAATAATRALARDVDAYVTDESGADQPAALASLVLVAEATGGDPTDFGGEDVAARLTATGPPAPQVGGSAGDAAAADRQAAGDEQKEAMSGAETLMAVGGVLAVAAMVAVAIGFSRRRGGR